nr:EcsC family protein [Piscibacillus salipiscarius]
MEQLTYLSDQQLAKSRVYSFAQGGLTGTGGWLFLGVDFPLIMTLNLRSVQLIGNSFGYDMNNPVEMILALKILHGGLMPQRFKYEAWTELKNDLNSLDTIMEQVDGTLDETWLEQPVNQLFKTLAIVMFRKKLVQGVPLISVGIGALSNYKLSKDVTLFAKYFYQHRFLEEQ